MGDWWAGRPWRLIQTNLREVDMRDICAERVVQDLEDFGANVLMINAAGIIASYPTKLPFQFQSPYLQGDSLLRILEACHAAGIRVFARTDFSKVRRPIFESHPDWAYRTASGDIVDYNGDVHVCVNSEYQQERALDIIGELLETHDFDGIFFNMGGYQTHDYSGRYYGPCHCGNCVRLFRESFERTLPTTEEADEPALGAYRQFQRDTVRALNLKVNRFVAGLRPDICIANHWELGRGFVRPESNTALDRPLPLWQYSGSDNTKWVVGSYPEMMSSNTTVDFIDFPYRHAAVSPYEQQLRLAQNLANGGALDYYLIGRLDNHEDRSGFAGIQEMFHFHRDHESCYADLESCAEIAVLRDWGGNTGEFRGWFRVLAESHYLFDTLDVGSAAVLDWGRYRAIVVPDLPALDDALLARVDAFTASGGTVIATGQSGFRKEHGQTAGPPALKSLGLLEALCVRTDTKSCYFRIMDKSRFPRLRDIDLVYLEGPYVHARYADDARPAGQLIAAHAFGPPERCYYTQVTELPAFTTRAHGRGIAVYLPWLPGAQYYRHGHLNTGWFMADLLEHVAGLRAVGGNLSPMVEVTRFRKKDGSLELLQLVNASGHFGVSYHPPVAMAGIMIEVARVHAPRSVRCLKGRDAVEWEWADAVLRLRLERLELFEAILVE